MTREYQLRLADGTIHTAFSAENLAAARDTIASDEQRYLPPQASRLYRLANTQDGAEKLVWNYPAAFDLYPTEVYKGLGSEDEDF